jgi:sulfatase maturation enzyme AslB (radical SAM superfamily)
LTQIKKDFVQGQWPAGCEACRQEEENNIPSKRQLDLDRWSEHYEQYQLDSDQLLTADLVLGNICNLKCIICDSYYSSLWREEYRKIYNIDHANMRSDRVDLTQVLAQHAPNLIHLDLSGGETFLSGVPEQKKMLKHYVESGQASNITLHYNTNVTVFPDEEWWELWSHFREIDIQLSLDGIQARFEYIRYPAVWATVVEHTEQYILKEKQLTNVRLSVCYTVSAYNIFYLDEFFTWCYNVGLPKPYLNRVLNPTHMKPGVWPNKQVIINQLIKSPYLEVRIWAEMIRNIDDSEHYEEFCQRLHQHDQYRGLDFGKTFPEMAPYIK